MTLEKDESGNWTTKLGESSVQLQKITVESAFNKEEDEIENFNKSNDHLTEMQSAEGGQSIFSMNMNDDDE